MIHPRATMRLQFHSGFTFDDAVAIVDYMARLGISHVYASPILTARRGSTHGYDVVDPTRVSDALGGRDGLERLVAALRRHDMGLIVDIVPNHMAVGAENPWWLDVLEKGEASPHARVFDIDWRSPDPRLRGADPRLRGQKVHAPFLGSDYDTALANGDIRLDYDRDAGRFFIDVHGNRFPVRAEDHDLLIGADRHGAATEDTIATVLADFREPESGPRALHRLLDRQHYRLAWWRTAADEVNWRRFFDIGELAAVRVEDPAVFEATHATIFDLYAAGLIDGLRIDHIDGLADPGAYCRIVRARLDHLRGKRPQTARAHAPLILVEKILAAGERLPEDWPVDGTTGYDFMNDVSCLLHDPSGRGPLRRLWTEITASAGDATSPGAPLDELALARRQMLATAFDSDLERCVRAFTDLAQSRRRDRDITRAAIRRVLIEVLAQFPVYRIYDDGQGHSAACDATIAFAVDQARPHVVAGDRLTLERLADWLHGGRAVEQGGIDAASEAGEGAAASPADLRRIALIRFQQLTAPLAAKAVEDTLFYRVAPLLSCNEVGADPDAPTLTPEDFHAVCLERQARHPRGLLATATHDHKRGADARMRIAVLSQMTDEWAQTLRAWRRMNAPLRHGHEVDGQGDPGDGTLTAPHPADEVMLYQTLIGVWPEGTDSTADSLAAVAADILPRVEGWLVKALREGKRRSNWVVPDTAYEAACTAFLRAILGPEAQFPAALDRFVRRLAPAALINSLTQCVLHTTTPGIPDIYQGTDVMDLSLVDPDNRRPVDHEALAGLLNQQIPPDHLIEMPRDHGAAKQAVLAAILALRARDPLLFTQGAYRPLTATGPAAAHVLAFARQHDPDTQHGPETQHAPETGQPGPIGHVIVLVSRLADRLLPEGGLPLVPREGWADTLIEVPDDLAGHHHDALTGESIGLTAGGVAVAGLLARLPVAVLVSG
ncbi:malto-oligosyltrehalose synthase (plasmid) [Tistrella bauzanensis]|uniref:Malto-oligosyltrehalose synthase n=1 Tax=Tistrella arctica TaxID=3133430 RepID=A0ABU9YLI5_9PROT